MKLKYKCDRCIKCKGDGCRTVVRGTDEDFDAGEYFAGVMARREYGRRGHVGPCRLDSWSEDGTREYYEAFIGVSNGNGMTGHNIRFVVTKEKV